MGNEKLSNEKALSRWPDTRTWDDALNWMEERHHLEALYWGGVLIWAGLVLLADSLAILPQVGDANAWSWFFSGAGLHGLLGNLYRVVSPNWSHPTAWDYIWSGFWLMVGLSGLTNADLFWPLVLLLVGVGALAGALCDNEQTG